MLYRGENESPKFRVAEATIQPYVQGETLTDFDLHTPYGGAGLRELLFQELGKNEIWHDSRNFDPEKLVGSDREATIRALIRCLFRPVDKAREQVS